MSKRSHVELHAHPNFKAYGLEQVVSAMEFKSVDVVMLSYLDHSISRDLDILALKLDKDKYRVETDGIGFRITRRTNEKEFYIVKGIELNTSDRFHVISIGYDKPPKKRMSIKETTDYALEKLAFVTGDHVLVNVDKMWLPIGRKKQEEFIEFCTDYSGKIAVEWNAYCKAMYWTMGKALFGLLGWKDPNRDIIRISERLWKKEVNVPVITSTDLHAKNVKALKALGTTRIIAELDLCSGRRIVDSLKEKVFQRDYENIFKEVSMRHFINYFACSYISQKFLKKEKNLPLYDV